MSQRKKTRVTEDFLLEKSQVSVDPRPSEPQMDGSSADRASPTAVRGFLEKLSLVITPSTLVIALAYWFGWKLTNARSTYFGIDSSTLGFSTTDYLLRSADATFVPIAIVLLVVLMAFMLHGSVQQTITANRGVNAVKRGAIGAAIAGAVLTIFGVWAMFRSLPVATNYLVPPVILGLGPALTAYSVWTLRHGKASADEKGNAAVPAWERSGYIIAAMLALLGIFWTASLYAAALGRGRAEILAENLAGQPAVTIFSIKSLGIDAAGVTVSEIANAASAYRFRYSGLRLLIHSANKYFMVNSGWSREHGVVIVLDDTPDIRLEFAPRGVKSDGYSRKSRDSSDRAYAYSRSFRVHRIGRPAAVHERRQLNHGTRERNQSTWERNQHGGRKPCARRDYNAWIVALVRFDGNRGSYQ